MVFLTVLKPGKSKTMALSTSTSGESHFFMVGHLFTISSQGRRAKKALWDLF